MRCQAARSKARNTISSFQFPPNHGIFCFVKNDLIQIDKAGRVVLPKAVREQLGLHAGDHLQVHMQAGSVELRPTRPGPRLEEVDGLLVLKGVAWTGEGLNLVSAERERHLEELSRRTSGTKS